MSNVKRQQQTHHESALSSLHYLMKMRNDSTVSDAVCVGRREKAGDEPNERKRQEVYYIINRCSKASQHIRPNNSEHFLVAREVCNFVKIIIYLHSNDAAHVRMADRDEAMYDATRTK